MELPAMKRLKLDTEARVCAAIITGQVVFFALAVWRYAL
jgi:hypothetical protein